MEHQRIKIEQSKGFRERLIHLSDLALAALVDYLEIRKEQYDADPIGWVFLYRNKTLSSRYCQQRLLTYGNRCGLMLSPHQLRCTCATLMLNFGVAISTIQTILGHKQRDTTLQYAHTFTKTIESDYKQTF